MKIGKYFVLVLILLAVFISCAQKQEPAEEKPKIEKTEEKQEIKKLEKQESALNQRLRELEKQQETLAQKEDSLERRFAELKEREQRLSDKEENLVQREKAAQNTMTRGRWMFIAGIVLLIIAIIVFFSRPRKRTAIQEQEGPPPEEKTTKTPPAEEKNEEQEEEIDPLYHEAVELVLKNQRASISFLQKELKIGYDRANAILGKMEEKGLVGPSVARKARELLITWEEYKNG